MFRSRRSVLIKRLWNLRLKHATQPDNAGALPQCDCQQPEETKHSERLPNAQHVPGHQQQQSSSPTIRALESFLSHFSTTTTTTTASTTTTTTATAATAAGTWSDHLEEFDDFPTPGDFKKSEANDFYEQLSLDQLEDLLDAVKGARKDQQRSDCILWSRGAEPPETKLPLSNISCHLYRWPDATPDQLVLRPLPVCRHFREIVETAQGSARDRRTTIDDDDDDDEEEKGRLVRGEKYICCNPYHWSRAVRTEAIAATGNDMSTLVPPDSIIINTSAEDSLDKKPLFSSSSSKPTSYSGAERSYSERFLSSSNPGYSVKPWCVIAYWEFRERVGRLFYVNKNWIDVFQSGDCSHLPQHLQEDPGERKKILTKCYGGDYANSQSDVFAQDSGICLKSLQEGVSNTSITKCRSRIGLGITVCRYQDGEVWVHNRSKHPIFVSQHIPPANSFEKIGIVPKHTWRTKIRKIEPGYCLKLADRDTFKYLTSSGSSLGPFCSTHISFLKGWGPSYSRQSVMQCPCWLEILLYVNR